MQYLAYALLPVLVAALFAVSYVGAAWHHILVLMMGG
jgi:hypothetical protein